MPRGSCFLLVLALASCSCSTAQSDCEALLADVHRDIDAESEEILTRGPDEAYFVALGLVSRERAPEVERLIDQAGLRPARDELDEAREAARIAFRSNLDETTRGLHERADAWLVERCVALPENERGCVARYGELASDRDVALGRCGSGDSACRARVLDGWTSAHPDCQRLEAWLNVVLAAPETR